MGSLWISPILIIMKLSRKNRLDQFILLESNLTAIGKKMGKKWRILWKIYGNSDHLNIIEIGFNNDIFWVIFIILTIFSIVRMKSWMTSVFNKLIKFNMSKKIQGIKELTNKYKNFFFDLDGVLVIFQCYL